jgi:gluconate 2-dehydrogenase gamma chain
MPFLLPTLAGDIVPAHRNHLPLDLVGVLLDELCCHSRRLFLSGLAVGLGAVWFDVLTPTLLAQSGAHAHAASAGTSFRFFTPEQAADFDAFSAQILPSDETPGAREANVVHFVDYAMTEIEPPQRKQEFLGAFKALAEQMQRTAPGAKSFAALSSEQQIAAMKAMEGSPAFNLFRGFTLAGMFCNPALGGNKDKIGWKLLGFEDTFLYKPPFGYYDAQVREAKS